MMKLPIRTNVRLSRYTTFRIGGPADYFARVESIPALAGALAFAREKKVPVLVLGGGSNLLICDRGFRGFAIKNALTGISRKNLVIHARSGEKLSHVVDFACKEGLSGLEFAAGIPGTLGGAIYGNAGAYGRAVGDLLIRAKLMERDGTVHEADASHFNFRYRWSSLKESDSIVISADFALSPGEPAEIRSKMNEIITERQRKHPDKEWGCAGSYFKNLDPPEPGQRRTPAGQLLEKVGAKGMKVGNAVVFPGHANFLTNPGGASAEDVRALAGELKRRVKDTFCVELEEEVLYIDEYFRCGEEAEGGSSGR